MLSSKFFTASRLCLKLTFKVGRVGVYGNLCVQNITPPGDNKVLKPHLMWFQTLFLVIFFHAATAIKKSKCLKSMSKLPTDAVSQKKLEILHFYIVR